MSLVVFISLIFAQHVSNINMLIPGQSPGETNPLFQMAISTQSPHTTQTEQ